ncbi:hypothetical protein V7128_23535 [Neobacillus vireti]|uniref:hypothetical protein n=1 Tax=Neobacillus vireti TaxID=220686 RepID=UPI002FFF0634
MFCLIKNKYYQSVLAGTKHAVRAISESLRKEETGNNIRSTIISPEAVTIEFTNSITDMDLKPGIDKIYEGAIARAVLLLLNSQLM